jgi:hypothetical protein
MLLAALAYHDARAGASLASCVERAERALAVPAQLGDEAQLGQRGEGGEPGGLTVRVHPAGEQAFGPVEVAAPARGLGARSAA